MSSPRFSTVFSLVWLLLLAGCEPSPPPGVSAKGSVRLTLLSPTALPADVSRVTVTLSAADMSPISSELVQTNGEYGGVLGDIPAGANRTFLARAFSASNTLRYEGRAEGVTITANTTTLVNITLLDVNGPPPFNNEAPLLDSLVASPASVAPGGTVSLVASAHDPNAGDSLGYAWTASAGTFASSTQASTTWTAPTTQGPVTLTVTVSDSRGASVSQRLTVPVAVPSGSSEVKVGFNAPPRVTALTSTQSTLDVGQQTALAVSAADADGDSLSYQWAATCAGSFTGATTTSATFTPSALPGTACNNCLLSVTVKDGRGGQHTGALALCVTRDPYLAPPSITRAYQSSTTATAGQDITFEVEARDPAAAALSFGWEATAGTLGAVTSKANSSQVTWTAPACANTAPGLTATASNTRNQKTTRSFTVTGLPTCPPAGWSTTGSLRTKRYFHTATLLPNGKVLVTGGLSTTDPADLLATAELYDPATGTWSPTSSLSVKRYAHTATLLLNGKVLVVGGSNESSAELYDPALGTWSPTGSLSTWRHEHQAVLLSNGKVLVMGGGNAYRHQKTELYDPATRTWSTQGDISWPRSFFASTLLANNTVLIAGGYSPGVLSHAEVYDPVWGTWSYSSSMLTGRAYHTATLLSSGKVLVAGGHNYNGTTYASAELYTPPSTSSWSTTGSMITARYFHTATRLSSGKVLVVGGSASSTSLAAAEIYDPATSTWSATSALSVPRSAHTATLLANGKVLVVGGRQGMLDVLASAELYDPGS